MIGFCQGLEISHLHVRQTPSTCEHKFLFSIAAPLTNTPKCPHLVWFTGPAEAMFHWSGLYEIFLCSHLNEVSGRAASTRGLWPHQSRGGGGEFPFLDAPECNFRLFSPFQQLKSLIFCREFWLNQSQLLTRQRNEWRRFNSQFQFKALTLKCSTDGACCYDRSSCSACSRNL